MVARPTAVLLLPLRPFSIGHELWLCARGNPLVIGAFPGVSSPEGRAALIEAVLVCKNSAAELDAMGRSFLARIAVRFWSWRIRKCNWALELEKFRQYLDAAYEPVPTMDIGYDGPARQPPGAPLAARLLQFLISECGLRNDEALDYPLAAARWRFLTHLEAVGATRIKNHHDYEFEDTTARMDAEVELAAKEGREPDWTILHGRN